MPLGRFAALLIAIDAEVRPADRPVPSWMAPVLVLDDEPDAGQALIRRTLPAEAEPPAMGWFVVGATRHVGVAVRRRDAMEVRIRIGRVPSLVR
jgi:hypothetical protein